MKKIKKTLICIAVSPAFFSQVKVHADGTYGKGVAPSVSHAASQDDQINYATLKNISPKDTPSLLYNLFAVDGRMGEKELIQFDSAYSDLMKNYDPINKDQSDKFTSLLLNFSKKYANNFPVGRVRSKLISNLHIKAGAKKNIDSEIMKNMSQGGKVEDFYKITKIPATICGYAYRAGRISGDKGSDFKNLSSMYFLLAMEGDLSSFTAYPLYAFSEKNSAENQGVVISIKTDRKVEKIKESDLENRRLSREAFDEFSRSLDMILVGCNNGTFSGNDIGESSIKKINNYLANIQNKNNPLFFSYKSIWSMWKIRNLARLKKDQVLLALSTSWLSEIKNNNISSDLMKRLASESLANDDDHIPKRIWCGPLTDGPDGKMWVIENGNWKKPDHPYDPKDYE